MINEEDSEESSEDDASSSEESNEEDVLSSRTLHQGKDNTFQNENLTTLDLTSVEQFSSRSKCIKSSSCSLIDVDNISEESPAKKVCELLE